MQNKKSELNHFDEMMFGRRQAENNSTSEESDKTDETDESFDLYQTIQLLNVTYQKLSPLKNLIKNPFKK
ncbi:hypothetical protein JCM21714_2693 [Gracilibacillus boraciitolerans JCM 21714]|uniref:Uncharacterized protein n=1 Tax=Gracilibacillus boraciitolerans JCM 21714 TaxID=1298598 RepID=W4VJL7_9BACI|nr:hypothetical protein [Gracilibacillus boraciitolerans]GAE93595.1 hypothetical protein JCM21714_2693 [Gracilibacillus boraciitolerans JCM 21714]